MAQQRIHRTRKVTKNRHKEWETASDAERHERARVARKRARRASMNAERWLTLMGDA